MSPPGLRSDVRGHSLSHIGILLSVESEECEQVVRPMNHLVLDLDLEEQVKVHLCHPRGDQVERSPLLLIQIMVGRHVEKEEGLACGEPPRVGETAHQSVG